MTKIELIRFARRAPTGQRGRYWKAVALYIRDVIENANLEKGELNTLTADQLEKRLLKGADNWRRYSEGGCACLSARQIGALIFPKGTKDARKQADWELEELNYWANGLIFAVRVEHPEGFEGVTDDSLSGVFADDEESAALCAAENLDLTESEAEEIRAAVKGA